MSTTITCLKELEEKGTLEYKDIVEFTIKEQIIKYKVLNFYLSNIKGNVYDNDEIFKILEIDKIITTEKAYNCKIINISAFDPGYWPQLENRDFPALTRLVAELYRIIEKTVYTKFTRFEIMEI